MHDYDIPRLRIPAEPYGFRGASPRHLVRSLARDGLTLLARQAAAQAQRAGYRFPDHFYGMLAGGNLQEHCLHAILRQLPEGTSEIMTHPGRDDATLERCYHWHYHWQDEYASACSPATHKLLQQLSIKLISYNDL